MAVTKVANLLLCMCAKEEIPVGMLKAKVSNTVVDVFAVLNNRLLGNYVSV